jgi:2-polyprenyl-3-methyl-5-hydroxy-6-metoxy-1,4-benzoquinol methylase
MIEGHFDYRAACPACHSGNVQQLYACSLTESPLKEYIADFYASQGGVEFSYLEGVDFILDECLDCELIYQRAVPNFLLMHILYERWIDPSKQFRVYHLNHGVDYFARIADEIEALVRYFGKKPNELKLLDFGMGWAEWSHIASAFGCDVRGIELGQSKIDYARKFGIITLDWGEIPPGEFDVINAQEVFEHVTDPVSTLTVLCSALKPEGIMKISVPNGRDIRKRLKVMDWKAPKGSKNNLNAISPLEHINCFNSHSLLSMARRAGLVPTPLNTTSRKKLLDRSVKEILRPYYRRVTKLTRGDDGWGTYVFFKKAGPA